MLIYNYKKEFLGVDESDLETFGLNDLADLRAESADFADLFIKTPGCIHNFKHVHWIDYVLDKNGAEAKVIIHIKNKNFTAKLDISTLYLVDNPSKKAYGINLINVKPLTAAQSNKLSNDILNQAVPESTTKSKELFTTPGSIVHDVSLADTEEDIGVASFDPYESDEDANPNVITDVYESTTEPLNIPQDDLISDKEESIEKEIIIENIVEDKVEDVPKVMPLSDSDDEYSGYIYNPQLASDELGLPIDLIEEFVDDFIAQANSFKDELYEAVKENELDTLKIQSHKLKGVAANLRIENALDALKVINTSSDTNEINTNLDRLYIMVTNLAQSEQVSEKVVVEEEDEDDDMILSFKDTTEPILAKVEDEDVPQKIDIPELADDNFVDLSIDEEEIQEDSLDLDTHYDREVIANDIGLDIESFNDLFEDYMKEAKSITQTITDAANNKDLAICKTMAAKLKGMSENMRIHKFDDELHSITDSNSSDDIVSTVETIVSKLNQI